MLNIRYIPNSCFQRKRSWRLILTPRDTCQHLKTFLIVITESGGAPGIPWAEATYPTIHSTTSQTKYKLPNSSSNVEKPWSKMKQLREVKIEIQKTTSSKLFKIAGVIKWLISKFKFKTKDVKAKGSILWYCLQSIIETRLYAFNNRVQNNIYVYVMLYMLYIYIYERER